ncbi:MAG: hypothetical protein IPK53_20445 [bacterium]|nr:hypothetical protein [bacterium]MBK8131180.1 hypothetical protein [bacterium]
MHVQLTRATILDLLPGYLSGDASAETRTLVEAFAHTDPQVAKILAAGQQGLTELSAQPVPLGLEQQALTHARRRIRWQAWQLALAIVLTVAIGMLGWLGTFLAALFWVIYYRSRERLHELLFGQR